MKRQGKRKSPLDCGEVALDNAMINTKPLEDKNKLRQILQVQRYQINKYHGDWTEEMIKLCIDEFFEYCMDKDIKPFKSLLALWLGISYGVMQEWLDNPLHGLKHTMMHNAMMIMEAYCQAELNEHTKANMFLLKTQHKYKEESSVNITNTTPVTTDDEIRKMVDQLGLDEDE